MTTSCHKPDRSEISDLDRIVLFEWHARHLKSWRDSCFPREITTNLVQGMDSATFHAVSIAAVLLRKFYAPKHVIKLPLVLQSLITVLPRSEKTLHNKLKQEIQIYKDYIRQSSSVSGPDEAMPDAIVEDIQYGLLIHSDQTRADRLIDMPRGWMHDMLVVQRGHDVIFGLLATIEKIREDGIVDLPAPLDAIWEPKKPKPMTIEEVNAMMSYLGIREDQPGRNG